MTRLSAQNRSEKRQPLRYGGRLLIARASMVWEQIWRGLWPAFSFVALFLALALFGVLLAVLTPHIVRLFGRYDDDAVALSVEATVRNIGISPSPIVVALSPPMRREASFRRPPRRGLRP